MNKRQFLATVAASTVALPSFAHTKRTEKFAGPVLLTVTGAIERANRGPLNPALDQMMHKQKIQFDKGYCFDFAALLAKPIDARFALCPWALYHIDVQAA